MKNRLLYIFSATLALCFAFQSCGLEEPTDPSQGNGGYIEFVARPTGFNNQTVATKATENNIENNIENCFFLIFDATTGERVGLYQIEIDPTTSTTPNIKIENRNLKKVKACFLANVPSNFASGIIGLTNPKTEGSVDNNYLDTAVLPLTYPDDYTNVELIGIPLVDHDSNSSTSSVSCIPMIGISDEVNLTTFKSVIEISLYRLLSKVSVSLDVDMGTLQAASYYTLISYKLNNLPNKVSLVPPASESAWVKDQAAFGSSVVVGSINKDIYNSTNPYTFSFYVPEYYLTEKANTTPGYGDQKYKPTMYDSSKFPVHLTFVGMYNPINTIGEEKKSLRHLVYLGENSSTSFTLKRNVHYTNLLTIKGFSNSSESTTLDHRVIIDETFNAVDVYAQSANCYIVNAAGTYVFPAVKGAHKGDLSKLADRYKCTQEGAYLKIESKTSEIEITDLNYNKESAEFSFTVPSVANGNAVVALAYKDSKGVEQIEWSWHIWFDKAAELFNQEVFEIASEKMPDGTTELMNRNLGTSPSTIQSGVPGLATDGVYYRSGRKEPYFNGGYKGGGVIIGSNGKEEYGWNDSKSPTDPCPPGYRVPSSSTWTKEANKNNATNEDTGSTLEYLGLAGFRYWNKGDLSALIYTDDIYYPYSGYLKQDGDNVTELSYITVPDYHSDTYTDEIKGSGITFALKFKNIRYRVYLSYKSGALHCTDNAFIYEAVPSGLISQVEIMSYDYAGRYSSNWSTENNPDSDIVQFLLNSVKKKLEEKISELLVLTRTESADNRGFQLRCLQEPRNSTR